MMAEILPVVSLLYRMRDHTHARPSENKMIEKSIYIHSVSRDWGSNPLHSFFTEIALLDGLINIRMVDHASPTAESWKNIVGRALQLPRWDFGWWGHDKALAFDAVRYLKGIVKRKLDQPPRGLVIQLRKSDPRLEEYYKSYFEQLLSSGMKASEFGNQDYSAYGAERRRVLGLENLARETVEAFPRTLVEIVEGADDLSLVSQMQRYMDAFGLVLGHGAGMVHALWLRPNATVIEVGPTTDLSNNYLDRITQVFGLRYRRVVCESHEDVSSKSLSTECGALRQVIRDVIREEEDRNKK